MFIKEPAEPRVLSEGKSCTQSYFVLITNGYIVRFLSTFDLSSMNFKEVVGDGSQFDAKQTGISTPSYHTLSIYSTSVFNYFVYFLLRCCYQFDSIVVYYVVF